MACILVFYSIFPKVLNVIQLYSLSLSCNVTQFIKFSVYCLRNLCLTQDHEDIFPCFHLKALFFLSFSFGPMIYLKWIFMYDVKWGSMVIFSIRISREGKILFCTVMQCYLCCKSDDSICINPFLDLIVFCCYCNKLTQLTHF